MKYGLILLLFIIIFKQANSQVKIGTKYAGVIKLTAAAAKKSINGKFDEADQTGNNAVDKKLNRFAAANKSNPKSVAAVENAAAEIKTDPEKYINPDGSLNQKALTDLLALKFNRTGNVTIPSPALPDSNTEQKNKASGHQP